jgi:hypothetical protein
MKTFTIVALILTLVATTGCLTTQSKTLVVQVAVQLATTKVIDGDRDRAARILAISSAVRAVAGTSRFDSVALLDSYIRTKIDWSKLTPEQTLLANLLLDTIRTELEARVGTGILTNDKLLVVAQVASWIESAAQTSGGAS